MDVEKIRELLEELAGFMREHNLCELEVNVGDVRVKLRKADGSVIPVAAQPGPTAAAQPGATAGILPGAPGSAPLTETAPPGTVCVHSPMVGTFYRTPKPDADAFVEVGDEVTEETVLCIIEAMKVMNEIKADHKGRVVRILAENGEPVEYGQPLFQIAT